MRTNRPAGASVAPVGGVEDHVLRQECKARLRHEPTKETRSLFRAEPNSLGAYALRLQPYRAYSSVDEARQRVVG
jgi:hypothetical protein